MLGYASSDQNKYRVRVLQLALPNIYRDDHGERPLAKLPNVCQ